MSLTVKITDDSVAEIVKTSLLESIHYNPDPKVKKFLTKAAAYYMTWEETVEHFGEKKARKLWCRA